MYLSCGAAGYSSAAAPRPGTRARCAAPGLCRTALFETSTCPLPMETSVIDSSIGLLKTTWATALVCHRTAARERRTTNRRSHPSPKGAAPSNRATLRTPGAVHVAGVSPSAGPARTGARERFRNGQELTRSSSSSPRGRRPRPESSPRRRLLTNWWVQASPSRAFERAVRCRNACLDSQQSWLGSGPLVVPRTRKEGRGHGGNQEITTRIQWLGVPIAARAAATGQRGP